MEAQHMSQTMFKKKEVCLLVEEVISSSSSGAEATDCMVDSIRKFINKRKRADVDGRFLESAVN